MVMEEIIKKNLDFYIRVVDLTKEAKIDSEVITDDEYMGGPGDDVVIEKVGYQDISSQLDLILAEMKNDDLIPYTKNKCLEEVEKYIAVVLNFKIKTEEELKLYSSQENPTLCPANGFENYQQKIKTLDEKVKQLKNC
ncbi:MAG: hypothetical protein AABX04_01045 [Nanoarchaeota archaeon]